MSAHAKRIGLVIACLCAMALVGCTREEPARNTESPAAMKEPHWVAKSNPPAKTALVFVHGLIGDTTGTWTNANGTTFFDLVKKHPRIGDKVDIFAFGFTSNVIGSGSLDVQAAANKLHDHLKYHGITEYPSIVFVAHSMGGLVSIKALLTHRELMERVPLMVFYATPQEGSDVARIAKLLANNKAIENLLPPDKDAFLRVLNDDWKEVQPRPIIRCAHENKPTFGAMIVNWSSATRFCTGTSSEISADHLEIVKPPSEAHDSVVVLVNALEEYVTGKTLEAHLEMPDFIPASDALMFRLADPSGRSSARLVNSGGRKLRYTLAQFSDDKLHVWPDTPRELQPNTTDRLVFALGLNASASEYRFVLQADGNPDRTVVVQVSDLGALKAQQAALTDAVKTKLTSSLQDPASQRFWKDLPADSPEAKQALVDIVRQAVAARSPELPEIGQWMMSAELLHAFNWPTLAAEALRGAEKASPRSLKAPSAMRLSAAVAAESGEPKFLTTIDVKSATIDPLRFSGNVNPLVREGAAKKSLPLAMELNKIPALQPYGSSLLGDIKLHEGDKKAAITAYEGAATVKLNPSLKSRISSINAGKL